MILCGARLKAADKFVDTAGQLWYDALTSGVLRDDENRSLK
jgi:hypothetical protein